MKLKISDLKVKSFVTTDKIRGGFDDPEVTDAPPCPSQSCWTLGECETVRDTCAGVSAWEEVCWTEFPTHFVGC